MHDSTRLALRLTLGGYLAVHGAQKLFGAFDGPGLDQAGAGFEHLGLKPGKPFAALAGSSELVGGVLTAAGALQPLGPLALTGAMAVASLTHADKGPMLQKGGFELPATNLAAALAVLGAGPGRYSLDALTGARLPRALTGLAVVGTATLTAYSAVLVVRAKRAAADRSRLANRSASPATASPVTDTPAAEGPAADDPAPDTTSGDGNSDRADGPAGVLAG